MNQELLIALFAGLGGMFGWGLSDFFAKKTIDRLGDTITLFWSQFLGIFPILLLLLFEQKVPHFNGIDWLFLIILGAWDGLCYVPAYVAFKKGQASLLGPIFATYDVLVVIISAVFFGEVIPFYRQVVLFIVFLGILLINGNPWELLLFFAGKNKRPDIVKGLPEMLLAVCLYSLWIIALDNFISNKDWLSALLVIRIFSAFTIFLLAKITHKEILFRKKRNLWKFIFLIGLFDVIAFSSVSYGLSNTSYTSVVAMLSSAFSLPLVLLAHFFLKEKTTKIQVLGGSIIIIGVMLLPLLQDHSSFY